MSRSESERKLIVNFWEKTLRNIIREAAWMDTEDEVGMLAEEVLVTVDPDSFDLYFQPFSFDSFGVGISKTKNNDHWAKDAIADALSHLIHLTAGEELFIRTMLLHFTVGSQKVKEEGSSIEDAVKEYLKKYPDMMTHWGVSVDKILEDNARVLIVLNYDLK